MDRSSMCRMPHCLRMSTCTCGSGLISSAKALSVNMVQSSQKSLTQRRQGAKKLAKRTVLPLRSSLASWRLGVRSWLLTPANDGQPGLVGEEGALPGLGKADLDLARGAIAGDLGHLAGAITIVANQHALGEGAVA